MLREIHSVNTIHTFLLRMESSRVSSHASQFYGADDTALSRPLSIQSGKAVELSSQKVVSQGSINDDCIGKTARSQGK